MTSRRSIYISGYAHSNPVPAACRKGNILVSGIVFGVDPRDHHVPPSLEEQCSNMFQHVRSIVEEGGGSTKDIVKVTIWMTDISNRDPVNQEWLKTFPDPNDRPARQAMQTALSGSYLVGCDFMAIIDE